MSVTKSRAKAGKASEKVASLMRDSRTSHGPCVLVVYERQEANIYYEGSAKAPSKSLPRGP